MRKLLLLFLLFHSPAYSGDFVTITNGPTLHISSYHFNSETWGFGMGYQVSPECAVAIGTYRNSYSRRSNYTALSCNTQASNSNLVYGFTLGTVTGYDYRILPLVFPQVGYIITKKTRIILGIIPSPGPHKTLALNLRWEVTLP